VIGGTVAKFGRVTLEIGRRARRLWQWHLIGPGSSAGRHLRLHCVLVAVQVRPGRKQSNGYVPILRDIHGWQSWLKWMLSLTPQEHQSGREISRNGPSRLPKGFNLCRNNTAKRFH